MSFDVLIIKELIHKMGLTMGSPYKGHVLARITWTMKPQLAISMNYWRSHKYFLCDFVEIVKFKVLNLMIVVWHRSNIWLVKVFISGFNIWKLWESMTVKFMRRVQLLKIKCGFPKLSCQNWVSGNFILTQWFFMSLNLHH